jgi:acetyl esterase/lipase
MKLITLPLSIIYTILKTIWIHFFGRGPKVPQWSLLFHVIVSTAKTYFQGFIGVKLATFNKINNFIMQSKAFGCKTEYLSVPSKFRESAHDICKAFNIKLFDEYCLDEDDKWEHSSELEICHIIPKELKGSSIKKSFYFLHGGGFLFGHPSCYHYNLGEIAKSAGIQVWGLNYRKAPKFSMLAIFEDLIAGYLYLTSRENDGGLGIRPQDIVTGGDSAGGCIAVQLIHFLRDYKKLGQVSGAVLWSPGLDFGTHQLSYQENLPTDIMPNNPPKPIKITDTYSIKSPIDLFCYYGGTESDKAKILRNGGSLGPPKACLSSVYNPLSHTDYGDLPPILIQTGASEFLRDDSYIYSKRVFSASLDKKPRNSKLPAQTLQIYEGQPHVFMILPLSPFRGAAVKRTANFVKICLNEELQNAYQSKEDYRTDIFITGTKKIVKKDKFEAYIYRYSGDIDVTDPGYKTISTTDFNAINA